MRYMGSKYGARKVTIDGVTFDSKLESQRWLFLKEKEKDGVISDLRRQVEYEIIPKQVVQETVHLKTKDKIIERVVERKAVYTADFVYIKNGKEVVEDVKGGVYMANNDVFVIKKKLMLCRYGIKVRIVTRPTEEI